TADSDGFFRVYLNSGRYHITVRSGSESHEWRDVLLGSAAGYDVDDMLAALAAGVYTSVADGLAATAEGDFFWVAHETGDDVLTFYRVVDGGAELWAALPRGEVVRELVDRAEAAAESAEEDAQAAQDALDAILALGDLPSAVAAAEQAAQSASASAASAATSASTASAAATAAEQAAQRAEDAAAATGLPSLIVPNTFLQAKADGSGYDGKTPAQVAEVVGPLIRAASQDEAGIVQLADAATAQGLTDTERVLTPATLGAAMNAHVLGMGQTWQDMTESRFSGVTYTNNTGRTIFVLISTNNNTISEFYIDDKFIYVQDNEGALSIISAPIPNGSTYRLNGQTNRASFSWLELR